MKNRYVWIMYCILLFLMMNPVAAQPRANFQTQGTEFVRSNNNSLSNGTYIVQYGYSVSIYNYNNTPETVLGNITYSMDADNIIQYSHQNYAQKIGSLITWTFPENVTLAGSQYILSSAKSDYLYERYIPITIHRWTNNSIFSSDGYQLANFSVIIENTTIAYANTEYTHIWGEIRASENSIVNATIVPDSFTTDFPIMSNQQDVHHIEFANSSPVETNRVYNFSVIIKVHRIDQSGPPIEYYPRFSISQDGTNVTSDPTISYNATTPVFMLPKYVHYAGGSTNLSNQWTYSWDYMLGFTLNETYQKIASSSATSKIGVFRPSNHMFYLKNGTTTTSINWGTSTDLPVTGDWNDDGITDIGVYRPSVHTFYLKNGTALSWTTTAINWGISTDLPVTGDWNGDGRTDVGIYRPSAHTFYLKNGTTTAINWGASTDLPVTGDWNGDGRTDVGVYRPSAHTFYLKNGTTTAINWGVSTDLPVTGKW